MITFPPFRLDLEDERLWKGSQHVKLRRKPFAILRYLAQHPHRLVSQDELLKGVWGDVVVSESAIRSQLYELRHALGDGVIETVIGRGYRFVAAIDPAGDEPAPPSPAAAPVAGIIGRDDELDTLRKALELARRGERQVVFLVGEPGVGKTTLVEAFLAELGSRSDVRLGYGQCIEQHGTPEAYHALLDAMRALALASSGDDVIATLMAQAPTLATQLPSVVPAAARDDAERRAGAGGPARMAREIATALETLAHAAPLVLALEDLQWSDAATLDLLAMLARRRERARVLVIATARRTEAQTASHPLHGIMRELVARDGARIVTLARFSPDEVARYLDRRFAGHDFSRELVALIHRVTDGTPLFVVAMVDDLVERGMIAELAGRWQLAVTALDVAAHRPDTIKQLIDIRLDRLPDAEQRLLEAASVVGSSFSTGTLAAALERPVEEVDDLCNGLARRGDVVRRDDLEEWPDGTSYARYVFDHGLYHEVCLARTSPARRQRWHRLIAERLEAAWGTRSDEIATLLAVHFDRAQALLRAAQQYEVAGARAAARFAPDDAATLYRRGVALVTRAPQGRERDELELQLLAGLSRSVIRSGADDASAPIDTFERHVELARRIGSSTQLFAALAASSVRHTLVGRYGPAIEVASELRAAAAADGLPRGAGAYATVFAALPQLMRGEVAPARAALVQALPIVLEVGADAWQGPSDLVTGVSGMLALADALTGRREEALALADEAIAYAEGCRDPIERAIALLARARVQYWCGDPPPQIAATARAVLRIPAEPADLLYGEADALVAWAGDGDESAAGAVEEALRAFARRAPVAPVAVSGVTAVVADLLMRIGRTERAATLARDALVGARGRGELLFEPELLRLQGDAQVDVVAARGLYTEAIDRAHAMGLSALEARAADSLRRVYERR